MPGPGKPELTLFGEPAPDDLTRAEWLALVAAVAEMARQEGREQERHAREMAALDAMRPPQATRGPIGRAVAWLTGAG
jgi:hypothetical protein